MYLAITPPPPIPFMNIIVGHFVQVAHHCSLVEIEGFAPPSNQTFLDTLLQPDICHIQEGISIKQKTLYQAFAKVWNFRTQWNSRRSRLYKDIC